MFGKKTKKPAVEKAALPKIISLNDLIKSSISDYKANWQKFVWLLIFPVSLMFIINICFKILELYSDFLPVYVILPLAILALAGLIYVCFLYVWAFIAEIRLTQDLSQKVDGKNIWKWYNDSRPQFWTIAAISFVYAVLALLFSIMLIVPGIIFMVSYCFAIYFVIFDGHEFEGAFGSSRALVKGYWWAVFGRIIGGGLAIFLLYLIISIILSILGAILQAVTHISFSKEAMQWTANFVSMFTGMVFSPLALIYMSKIFRSLQEVKK